MNLFWETIKLLVVLGLILIGIVYFIKYGLVRLQPDYYHRKGALQIVERLPLSQKNGLYLVQAGENYYLLGVCADSITMLSQVDKEDVLSSLQRQESEKFKNYLDRSLGGRDGGKVSFAQKIQALISKKLHGGDSDEE